MKKNNNRLMLFLLTFWIIYSFLFNKYQYKIGIIFSFIYILKFITSKKEEKYYLIIFTLPFAAIFKISSSMPSTLMVLSFLFIVFYIFERLNKISNKIILSIIILFIFQLITIYMYMSSILSIISFIINITFMTICIVDFKKINNIAKQRILQSSILYFSFSMSLSIVIADIFPQIPYFISEYKQTLLMSINRFSGLNTDPNYYSQLILVSAALLTGTFKDSEKNQYRKINIFLFLFLIVCGFRSISKSYAITFVLFLCILGFYRIKSLMNGRKNIYKKYLNLLSFIIFFIGGVILITFNIAIPLIESRTDTNDLLTGRGDIWLEYIDLLKNHFDILIFGTGFGNSATVIEIYYGHFKAAHNIYLELITELGIMGLLVVGYITKDILINIKVIMKNPSSIYLLIFFITGFGLAMSSTDILFILIPLSILMIRK